MDLNGWLRLNLHKCRRCNRPLTDAKSIEEGIGPICKEKEKQVNMVSMWELIHGEIADPDNGWNPAWVSDDFDTWLEERKEQMDQFYMGFVECGTEHG
tara:strand:+ start:830 stop:1123 length:294 start_codon:yes stop_codon:yes gene_type:complete